MNYRREIDGLRALALIPVILFHAGFDFFGGGFVGVDIFFVISGYLISAKILSEKGAGTFSLLEFYERRIRRILPALFFITIVCIPFSWIWLLPGDFKDFSQSLVAVSLLSSNLLFWQESGYFDTSAELKPLLHTWSLAVEEQFYLFFPAILLIIFRFFKRRLNIILIIIFILSFSLAHYATFRHSSFAFFLLPARMWEFLIGTFIAFHLPSIKSTFRNQKKDQLGSAIGFVMIIISILFFDKETPFPGLYALLPTVGAGLVILFAHPPTVVGTMLGSRIFVGVGLISYSAYLWHHPFYAFARYRGLDRPGSATYLFLSPVILGLAYLTWKYVETPFRKKLLIKRNMVFQYALISSVSLLSLGLIITAQGNSRRFSSVKEIFPEYEIDNKLLQQESWKILRKFSGKDDYQIDNNDFDNILSFDLENEKIKVLVIGNSHSKDLINMFIQNKQLFKEFEFVRYGIQIACLNENEGQLFFESPNYKSADVILVSTLWRQLGCKGSDNDFNDYAGAKYLASKGVRDGKQIVLTSNTLKFSQIGNSTLADDIVLMALAGNPKQAIASLQREKLASHINSQYYLARKIADGRIQEIASNFGLIFLNKSDFLCDENQKLCFGIAPNYAKCFYDDGHYTLQGAAFFGQHAHAINWLKPIILKQQKLN